VLSAADDDEIDGSEDTTTVTTTTTTEAVAGMENLRGAQNVLKGLLAAEQLNHDAESSE